MTKLQNESFIRSQIRRILREDKEEDPKEKEPKKKPKGDTVLGGIGRGNISGMMKDIFGGGTKQQRLAESNPEKLMRNLQISDVRGSDDQEKTKSLLSKAVSGTEGMSEAFGPPEEKKDGRGRWGYLITNKGLEKDRYAVLFVYDTVRGAVGAKTLELSEKVKVEAASGGALVYGVGSKDERWNQ